MKEIIIYLLLALISFIPIIIWAYTFSYIDSNNLSRKRFLLWVFGWSISVIPILYFDKIIDFFNLWFLNSFNYVYKLKDISSTLDFSISLSLFLLFIVCFSFLSWFIFKLGFKNLFIYLKNLFVFLIFIVFLSLFLLIIWYFLNSMDLKVLYEVSFWNMVFNSFKLIVFYYFIVAFIEESSKHFNFLNSDIFSIDSVKKWVSYAIYIALGFSFIENILYIYSFYNSYGIWYDMLKIYFFRSSFSIIVHVVSSTVIAYYFTKAYLVYKWKDLSFSYLKVFSLWLFLSILLHLIYDVSISLGFSFIMFIYFIGGYLYVSSIFYDDEQNKESN